MHITRQMRAQYTYPIRRSPCSTSHHWAHPKQHTVRMLQTLHAALLVEELLSQNCRLLQRHAGNVQLHHCGTVSAASTCCTCPLQSSGSRSQHRDCLQGLLAKQLLCLLHKGLQDWHDSCLALLHKAVHVVR